MMGSSFQVAVTRYQSKPGCVATITRLTRLGKLLAVTFQNRSMQCTLHGVQAHVQAGQVPSGSMTMFHWFSSLRTTMDSGAVSQAHLWMKRCIQPLGPD